MVFRPKKRNFEESLKKIKEVAEEVEEEEFEEELEVPTPSKKKPVNKVVQEQQEEIIWSAEEIPTATSTVIYNAKENKSYSLMESIAELLNRTE